MSIAERGVDEPEEWLYFVQGTTMALWQGGRIDPVRGGGDFGAGFYVFEDTNWGRQGASEWARQKARVGGDAMLVRLRISRPEFELLDRWDVPGDEFGEVHRRYSRRGLTGRELIVGPVGRRGMHGGRVPDYSLPVQYKFEGTGIVKLVVDSVIPVS